VIAPGGDAAFDALDILDAVAADVSRPTLNRGLRELRERRSAKEKLPPFVPGPFRVFGVFRGWDSGARLRL